MEVVAGLLMVAFLAILAFSGMLQPVTAPQSAQSAGSENLRGQQLQETGMAAVKAEEYAIAAEEQAVAAEQSGDPVAAKRAEKKAMFAARKARMAEEAAMKAQPIAAELSGDELAARKAEHRARWAAKKEKELEEYAMKAVMATTTALQLRPGLRPAPPRKSLDWKPHPMVEKMVRMYSYQPVRNERGQLVNIVLVRAPLRSKTEWEMFEKFKDEILFIGICSFEDYPLPSPNPFSGKFKEDTYVGLFPGFLHMFRHPEKIFPPHVKLLLMSQSDFSLPPMGPQPPKKYDFVYSGSDQDVHNDCVGWASFAKNWSMVKDALKVMCGELDMTGVLIATKDKANKKACTIPQECQGKVIQTQYIDQGKFFDYARQSHFALLPQVHDASPRVATQVLSLNVPMLMNYNLMGGWKYMIEGETGEFFHDINDFKEAAIRIKQNAIAGKYRCREYIDNNYGDAIQGPRLRKWIEEEFSDRVALPPGTKSLFPAGA